MDYSSERLQFYEPSWTHPVSDLADQICQWIASVAVPDFRAQAEIYEGGRRIILFYFQGRSTFAYIMISLHDIYGINHGNRIFPQFVFTNNRAKISPLCKEIEAGLFQYLKENGFLASPLSLLIRDLTIGSPED